MPKKVPVSVADCGSIVGWQPSFGEPVVTEVREGTTSTLRITATDGSETIYRIDFSQRRSPATERTDLIKKWESYRLGAFVCFNSNQFSGIEICQATDPKTYNPQQLDVAGWIAAFKQAGMKYAVLTVRHTSGFLLWDSPTSDFDVANSGNTTDVCREFVDECRKQGIVPAFYYCLWGGRVETRPQRQGRDPSPTLRTGDPVRRDPLFLDGHDELGTARPEHARRSTMP